MNSNRQESINRKLLPYHLAALSVVLMIVAIVYFDTFASMVEIWLRSDTFLHGFIILPVSVYLIWRKWPQLKTQPPKCSYLGVFLLSVVSVTWFFADVLGIQVGKHFAAIALIPVAFLAILGFSLIRAITFPLLYLFFAVPFGEFWVPGLMEITADFAVVLLQITGIPVFRDGLFLNIPAGSFVVAEACSGIRYILAALALGTIYAYLNFHRTYKRLIFIVISLVVPIVANGIRAYGIIAIAHYSDMKYAVGVDHLIYGWMFFGVVIGLMFLVGNRYRDEYRSIGGSVSAAVPVVAPTQPSRLAFAALVAAAATMFGPLASQAIASKYMQESELSNGLPNAVAGWQGTVLPDSDWTPSFIGATQESLVRYLGSEAQVDVVLIRYIGQRQGNELANVKNSIFGTNGWRRRNTRTLSIELGEGKSVQILETLAVRRGVVRRFWYWYEVDGNAVNSNLTIKLNEALSLLTGKPAVSSVVIVSVIEESGGPDVLQAFLDDAYDVVTGCLGANAPQAICSLGLINAGNN